MRIIQIIQKPQLRGAELFACQLSNHLISKGHSVMVISIFAGDAQLPFHGEIIKLQRPITKRFFDSDGWRMLAKEITKYNPDIVQANAGDTLKFAIFSKITFGWKVPVILRNANKVSDFITSAPKKWLNKFFVNKTAHVISVSDLCRLDFIDVYTFPNGKITTVPIGIELTELDPSLPADLINPLKDDLVIVNVASLVPEKNQIALIGMVKQLVKQHPHLKLILVGDGRQRQEIETKIEKEELRDHVLILGYRNDVLRIISNAHAFVLPSLIEGLPGVILEAQYCKTPVIAYNVGGISEVIEDGKTGWLIDKNDENSFIQTLSDVLNGQRNYQLIEKAYHQVTSQFSNSEIADRFLDVYRQVSGKSR